MATLVSANPSVISHTPGAAVSAGDVIVIGDLVTVVTVDSPANVPVGVATEGVFSFPKTASAVIGAGVKCYWDPGTGLVTTTAGELKLAGHSVEAVGNPSSSVKIKLGA